jgi:hypothetical protein
MIPSVPRSAALAMHVGPNGQQGRDLALVMAVAAQDVCEVLRRGILRQPCVHLPGRVDAVHQCIGLRAALAQDRRARQAVGGVVVIGHDAPRHRRAQPVEIGP